VVPQVGGVLVEDAGPAAGSVMDEELFRASGAGEPKYVEGHVSGVGVPVAAQGGSQLACPLVGEEYARAVDLDDLVGAGNGVA
jgi:hypothetical protein